MMSEMAISYVIEPQIPPTYIKNLFEFIYRKFLLPQRKRFVDISGTTVSGEPFLTYTVVDSFGKRKLRV